jgi:nucleoside-diphosphate-sugar epimerase
VVNTILKEADLFCPNSVRINFTIYLDLLRDPQYADIKPTLIHLPDYFGPTARNSSYLGATMIGIAQKKMTFYIGPKKVEREFVYLPDAAKMIVNIVLDPSSYGQSWNIPGQIITGKKLIDYANKAVNNTKPVLTMTRLLINIVGLFDANVKEISEMYYLTTNPVFLNSEKYQKHFGHIIKTPFNKSISTTIKQIAEK